MLRMKEHEVAEVCMKDCINNLRMRQAKLVSRVALNCNMSRHISKESDRQTDRQRNRKL